MADFKDLIIRLQENKADNREVIETQTRDLSSTVVETAKTQNRSFGQSLALQFKRNNEGLSSIRDSFTNNFQEMISSAEDQANAAADRQQTLADEAERKSLLAKGGGKGGDGGEAAGVGKETKKGLAGILGKLGLGAGSAMLGGGALLAGAGILAGGAGFLLKELNDLDGKAVRANVKELMGISDDMGGKVEFFLEGGAFLGAMTGIGLGLAAFSIGAGVATAVDHFSKDTEFAKNIRANVKELLAINDDHGGSMDFLKKGGTFGIAMTAIGFGLAAVSAGVAVSKAFDMFSQGDNQFAVNIRKNVKELLSINDDHGGTMDFLSKGGGFGIAMTAIGAGLAVFGLGSAVATLVDTGGLFANPDWATSIVKNVSTLLSINDLFEGFGDVLKEGGTFFIAMSAIAAGLTVFSAGTAVAALVDAGGNFANKEWAQSIVDNVETLLTIASLPGVLVDTAAFVATMTGIGAGLLAFSVGKGAAGLAEAITQFSGTDNFAQTIKDNVKDLLSITADENINKEKAIELSSVLGTISAGLLKFSGAKFVDALAGVGASILNFFSGNESPVQEMLDLADNATELTTAANALDQLAISLNSISGLKFDGSKIKMKEFARDLGESVPLIEAAIMGGSVDLSWFPTGNTKYLGLASPEIDFESATQRIMELRQALGQAMVEQTTLNAESQNKAPVVVSDSSVSNAVVNNSSSSFSVQKSTTAPDLTMDNLAYDF